MFAISSRRNSTSSTAAPSWTATAPGAISSPSAAWPSGAVIANMRQCRSGLTVAVGSMRKRSPKVVAYVTDSTVVSEPNGTSTGTTSQSLPYVNANSATSSRARSHGSASTRPRLTCASSISELGAGRRQVARDDVAGVDEVVDARRLRERGDVGERHDPEFLQAGAGEAQTTSNQFLPERHVLPYPWVWPTLRARREDGQDLQWARRWPSL